MSQLFEHHRAKCGVEGKCSVPMWMGGIPAGFCDSPAWGEQYSEVDPSRGEAGKYSHPSWPWRDRNGYYPPHLAHLRKPYASALCCSAHGGPDENSIRFVRDGNMWCAFRSGFVNLQESIAGFGETQTAAEADLIKIEKREAASALEARRGETGTGSIGEADDIAAAASRDANTSPEQS